MKNLSVIGIGRLGLCFCLTLESAGYNVIGCDIRKEYIMAINKKAINSFEPGVNEKLLKSKNFRATLNLKETISHSKIIFVTVATYSEKDGKYDVSQVDSVVSGLLDLGVQEKRKHLIICSNVNPGYSDSVSIKLKRYNWDVSFNPETVAQGTILKNQSQPDCVYIGAQLIRDANEIEEIYRSMCINTPKIFKMDRLSAELTKISLNCYLTCKISFANMVGDLAAQLGADPKKILSAVGGDSRINSKFFNYGFGWGGPCFPRDTRAFIRLSKNNDMAYDMCAASNSSNMKHLDFQVNQFLKTGEKTYYTDSVTYKRGTSILEESQQLIFAKRLAEAGVEVVINESAAVKKELKEIYGDLFKYV